MTAFKIVVVRTDGLTHSTDVNGWSAETTITMLLTEALANKRTLYVGVFEGVKSPHSSDVVWSLRSQTFNAMKGDTITTLDPAGVKLQTREPTNG